MESKTLLNTTSLTKHSLIGSQKLSFKDSLPFIPHPDPSNNTILHTRPTDDVISCSWANPIYTDENILVTEQNGYSKPNNERFTQTYVYSVEAKDPSSGVSYYMTPQQLGRIYADYLEYKKIKDAAKDIPVLQTLLSQLITTYKLTKQNEEE